MVTADRQERLLCKSDTDTLCQITTTEGASAPSQLTEITMQYDYILLDYGYNVKYKNGTLYLTDRRWKYMFDATTLKLGDLKYALKHYNIDSLPYLAKFRRHSDTNLWELYATK